MYEYLHTLDQPRSGFKRIKETTPAWGRELPTVRVGVVAAADRAEASQQCLGRGMEGA